MKKEGIILNRATPGRKTSPVRINSAHRGFQGEARAAGVLMQCGLNIVERNFRCRFGEVDLIAWDGDTLVFVEVRWRSGVSHGGAGESIDRHKQRRFMAAARVYLMRWPEDPPCRFDAVLLEGEGLSLCWLKGILWL